MFQHVCNKNSTYLLTYLLTHSLTHSTVQNIWKPVTQLIKKYPAFFMEPEGSSPGLQKPTSQIHFTP